MSKLQRTESGFSTIELLITLFVASAFIAIFYQLFLAVEQSNAEAKQQATASSLAYSNMRKFTTRPDTFTQEECDDNDLTVDADAAGFTVFGSTDPIDYPSLPGTVRNYVKVYAPQGCSGDLPVKIESTVEYGNPVKEAVHATFVN